MELSIHQNLCLRINVARAKSHPAPVKYFYLNYIQVLRLDYLFDLENIFSGQ